MINCEIYYNVTKIDSRLPFNQKVTEIRRWHHFALLTKWLPLYTLIHSSIQN